MSEMSVSLSNISIFRSKTQRLEFSLSISYNDVSQPAVQMFSTYPVIEAKFPHDFFYPFVSSNSISVIHQAPSLAGFVLQFYMLLHFIQ